VYSWPSPGERGGSGNRGRVPSLSPVLDRATGGGKRRKDGGWRKEFVLPWSGPRLEDRSLKRGFLYKSTLLNSGKKEILSEMDWVDPRESREVEVVTRVLAEKTVYNAGDGYHRVHADERRLKGGERKRKEELPRWEQVILLPLSEKS